MVSFKKIENLNLWMVQIIIFTIPIIPLYTSPSMMFPFITGKNFAFRILVELAAVLWLGLIAANKEYRIRNSSIVLSILTFTFIVGLADLTGVNPYKSFWSNFERMEGYVTILHLALYFMIIKSVFKTRKDWKIYFSIVLLVSVLVSLYPFVTTLNTNTLSFRRFMMEYGAREFSTLGNPPFLASYLLLSSFIGLMLVFHTQKKYLRFVYIMAIAINCVVIYLTATRGAILSAIAGVIMFISLYVFRRSKKSGFAMLKQTVLFLLVISLFISGAFFIFSENEFLRHDPTLSRFASMLSSESIQSRFNGWEVAWNGIKERPVLGWGQENFIGSYTVTPIAYTGKQVWMDRAHNIVIEWLVNAGILGLFSYLAIFGSAFYVLRKADREKVLSKREIEIVCITLMVYFIQNLFTFDTINTYMMFFSLLAYIDNLSIDETHAYAVAKNKITLHGSRMRSVVATLASLLLFSIIFYHANYKPMRQSRHVIGMSFNSHEDDSYSKLLRDFNIALSFNTLGNSDVRDSMRVVSDGIFRMQHFNQPGALGFVQATVEELRKELAIKHYDLEFITGVIYLFNKIAVYEKKFITLSEGLISKCIRINPEYQGLYMLMADLNLIKKDYESAFENIKKVVDQNPNNDYSQFKLAVNAVYTSREEVAKQALENVRKIRESGDQIGVVKSKTFLTLSELYELAQVYREMKRYTIALQYLEETFSIRDFKEYLPQTKAQIHLEMARVFLKLNDRANALKEAEKALVIDPALSEDVNTIIDSFNN